MMHVFTDEDDGEVFETDDYGYLHLASEIDYNGKLAIEVGDGEETAFINFEADCILQLAQELIDRHNQYFNVNIVLYEP